MVSECSPMTVQKREKIIYRPISPIYCASQLLVWHTDGQSAAVTRSMLGHAKARSTRTTGKCQKMYREI